MDKRDRHSVFKNWGNKVKLVSKDEKLTKNIKQSSDLHTGDFPNLFSYSIDRVNKPSNYKVTSQMCLYLSSKIRGMRENPLFLYLYLKFWFHIQSFCNSWNCMQSPSPWSAMFSEFVSNLFALGFNVFMC